MEPVNPRFLVPRLLRGIWWIVFLAFVPWVFYYVSDAIQSGRWFQGGMLNWSATVVWAVICRAAAPKTPRWAVVICMLGLIPLVAWGTSLETGIMATWAPTLTERAALTNWPLLITGALGGPVAAVFGFGLNIALFGVGLDPAHFLGAFRSSVLSFAVGLGFFYLIRALEDAYGKLEQLSLTDELTGVGNRRALLQDAPRLVSTANGTLTIWDLDHLKMVNDAQGHAAGDAHIRAFVHALKLEVTAQDKIYRTGGDEFVVLHPNLNQPEHFAARVRSRFHQVSWGFAPVQQSELEAVMAAADARMYTDKRHRKQERDPEHNPAPSFARL
jgi:diguanylate cyclase (GGDEF)-like protein